MLFLTYFNTNRSVLFPTVEQSLFQTSVDKRSRRFSKSDLRLSRISILSHKITRITCEHVVVYLSNRATSKTDHFTGAGKMVYHFTSCISASFLSFFQNILKLLPLGITDFFPIPICTPTFSVFPCFCFLRWGVFSHTLVCGVPSIRYYSWHCFLFDNDFYCGQV